jgi:hypothetical protein
MALLSQNEPVGHLRIIGRGDDVGTIDSLNVPILALQDAFTLVSGDPLAFF